MTTLTRREFVAGASLATASSFGLLSGETSWAQVGTPAPWQRDIRRIGQLNFNATDPLTFDVEAWMDYWASLDVDTVVIGFGGIMATYPTHVPFHHRSEFLGSRDLTGETVKAARRRKMRVVARMDCNYAYQDALEAHPEWFMRHKDGSLRLELEAAYLYKTCQFSTYFTEQMPAIYREIGALYAPDAIFTNGWPGTAAFEMCYCVNCQKVYREQTGGVPPPTTDARSEIYRRFYDVAMKRVVDIWSLWDRVAKEKNPEAVYFGDLGGGNLQMVKDLKTISTVSTWYAGDHQGRTGEMPIWSGAAQGRIAKSVMQGKTTSNIVAAWSYNLPKYRHTANPDAEMELWLAQLTALGMAPWEHWLGGSPRDTRWKEPAKQFYTWMAAHDRHLRNRRSLAEIAVLYPQRTLAFYQSNGTPERTLNGQSINPEDYLQGLYYALLESRILFDFVHQEDLSAETLAPYRVLLLPNAAYLRDSECEAIRQFAARGGSVLATFETSRYNEWGDQREDFGLRDLFGVSYAGNFPGGVVGPFANSYMEIRQEHPVLDGFQGTEILPGAEYRVEISHLKENEPVLTLIPHSMSAMPEFIYPRIQRTEEPAAIFRQSGSSRVAYFPGDIDRTAWKSGHPDFTHLVGNTVRWLAQGKPSPVTVQGKGLVELFAWETDAGWAIHIVNYTNPRTLRPSLHELYPIGPLKVTFSVPNGRKIGHVRALRAGSDLHFTTSGDSLEFSVPTVEAYEVIALTS